MEFYLFPLCNTTRLSRIRTILVDTVKKVKILKRYSSNEKFLNLKERVVLLSRHILKVQEIFS